MKPITVERHVNGKTVEDIFSSEGWIYELGDIAQKVRLVDETAVHVYPQDVVDAVRYIVREGLVQKGCKLLLAEKDLVELTYQLSCQSNVSAHPGRFIPNLELSLNKHNHEYTGEINAGLNYRYNPNYIAFAQFRVSADFISRLLSK